MKIPAGVKDGTRIRLKGKGEPGAERRARRRPLRRHARRARRRSTSAAARPTSLVDVPVSFPTAALGGKRRGADARGRGLAEDSRRLRGRQAAAHQGPRRAEAEGRRQGRRARARAIDVPKKLNKRGRELLEEFQKVARLMTGREHPRYMICVAAELVGMHPQTLRIYEQKGLVRPKRTAGNTRLYSEADLERLRLIQRLTTELGLNLAGVEHVLRLEDELRRMHARLDRLEREMREAIDAGAQAATGATSCRVTARRPVIRRRTLMDFDKLTLEVAGGRRRRAGAGAPPRQPRALSRAPAARAARPGAAAAARSRRGRAARAGRGDAARRSRRSRARSSSRSVSAAFSRVLDKAEDEAKRLEDDYVSTEHLLLALDVVPRDELLGADQGGARRPARHVAGSGGHVPGAREVRPRPDRGRRGRASSTRSSAATRRSAA